MWWFFVRDFYRLADAKQGTGNLSGAAKRYPESAATTAPTHHFTTHMQRLATDGAQAFGVWDVQSGFVMFSANWSGITGLPMEVCAGFNLVHQLHPEDQFAFHDALQQAGSKKCTLLARSCDETLSVLRHLLFDILPPTAAQPYATVLVRDITAQKQLEEALTLKEAALHTANRSRSAFLSCMSHELRTPLNAIIGFSSMMREEMLGKMKNPTYAEYADHIHDAGGALLGKISDLLEIAALDAGGMRMDESIVDIPTIFAELHEMHSHTMFTRNQTLHIDAPEISVFIDKRKVICALSHMLANAIRHSPENAAIYLQCTTLSGGEIVLSVRDYGEGIGAESLANIHHALRAPTSYAHIRSDGIGLGLSLSKEIATQHGGHVMLDAMRKQGTVVSLVLPANRLRGSRAPAPRLVKR
jgi:signal transduction histidine kinase